MADGIEGSGVPIQDHPHYIANLKESYAFFSDMQDDEIYQFLRLCKRQVFEEGATIFNEGDVSEDFFLILSGEIVIQAGGQELSRLRSGKIFGEMGILEHEGRNAAAWASEKAEVFSVSRKILETKVPALGFKIACNIALQLSTKLRQADEQLKNPPAVGG